MIFLVPELELTPGLPLQSWSFLLIRAHSEPVTHQTWWLKSRGQGENRVQVLGELASSGDTQTHTPYKDMSTEVASFGIRQTHI